MSTKTAKAAMAKKGKKGKKGKDTAKVLKQTKKDVAEKATKATKKTKKTKEEQPVKKSKEKEKVVAKKGKSGEFRANNRDHDDWIVKRLIKENPRREGTYKAKVWSLLKKGMTVKQFVEKGGGRTEIQRYIESGWVKLLRPSASE